MPAPKTTGPRLLIIDNYDSYTFNLYQYFIRANKGQEPVVIRNDQFTWKEMQSILPYFDGIIISPGPGNPSCEKDFGICAKVLAECKDVPIFGVCLGHQGLASVLGGEIVKAADPMHGRTSPIYHDGQDIFFSVPSPFEAVRYHSLLVSPNNLPKELAVNAWCNEDKGETGNDPILMGFRHLKRPVWSVQFHPESICTEYGQIIVNNFCNLVEKHWSSVPSLRAELPLPEALRSISVVPSPLVQQDTLMESSFHSMILCLDNIVDSEAVFSRLYETSEDTFWLDSARIEKGLSRYSYMGNIAGPNGFRIHYSLDTKIITKVDHGKKSEYCLLENNDSNFFEYLAHLMDSSHCDSIEFYPGQVPSGDALDVPPFMGGLVGYIGYEMKSETLALGKNQEEFRTKSNSATTPDSSFLFTDRTVVFDHEHSKMYLVALVQVENGIINGPCRKLQSSWLNETSDLLKEIQSGASASQQHQVPVKKIPQLKLAHSESEYMDMIRSSVDMIREGDTYEVCLTTQLQAILKRGHPHPFELYKHLRHRNPAPYAAYLALGDGLFVASSSPERFLRVDKDRTITMKPIKGTLKRANQSNFKGSREDIALENEKRCLELASSEKNRSENLMIVDLIRNDLNQISALDSVHVPALMVVESYATVHQLVTTVASTLRPELSPVDAVMRSFPPGSMTGAPKLRTVQLIETLENIPRGPYSGVLGFFSVSGPADFNVVIRTSVFSKSKDFPDQTLVSVGAGGAIVILSDPKEEFDEMVLKAHSVLPSLSAVYHEHFHCQSDST